ncbi:YfbK domain-containing protein [Reichenbachiella versicolor]|uniref:YfbK domain-containing protein n=1 Tax=Reichenbachiella versicolor TaxID=1821036 RepID=UPI000D6E7E96|nr:YfbK domain-containing protein [Reichenbachiella versicolor]
MKFHSVAKNVKIQVSFNKQVVESYRLIGYENRVLNEEDFDDDEEDAGEIGAGQNITALYEVVPVEINDEPSAKVELRYKNPDADKSNLLEVDVIDSGKSFSNASDQMQFVAGVAAFGMQLRGSQYKGDCSYNKISDWLKMSDLDDQYGFKSELIDLVEKASKL